LQSESGPGQRAGQAGSYGPSRARASERAGPGVTERAEPEPASGPGQELRSGPGERGRGVGG
jgi:hypothetical protein